MIRLPLSFFFLGPNNPVSFSTPRRIYALYQLCCPFLDILQYLNVFLWVRGQKLDAGFEVWPHQCWAQWDSHCPGPVGSTFALSQIRVPLAFLVTWVELAYFGPTVDQHPQVLHCWAASQPLWPQPAALDGVVLTRVQDPALGFVEHHTTGLSLSRSLCRAFPTFSSTLQLDVVHEFSDGAPYPFLQIIDKDIEQDWTQNWALGNAICDQLPTGTMTIVMLCKTWNYSVLLKRN